MSALSSDRPVQLIESTPAADPAPLGLAGFALTTFLLSGHNASLHPGPDLGRPRDLLRRPRTVLRRDVGVPQPERLRRHRVLDVRRLLDGPRHLHHPRRRHDELARRRYTGERPDNSLAWFLFAFAVFNTYMLIGSMRVNTAVFMVFLTLEITEILLVIGFFNALARRARRGGCTRAAGPASSRRRSPGTRRRRASGTASRAGWSCRSVGRS